MNTDSRLLSPFNIKDAVKMDYFTLDETKELIKSYTIEHSVNVSDDVISALYDYTKGYGGKY